MARANYKFEDSVFITCPFDSEYRDLLQAIVFAIHTSGFVARSALESMDSGQNRLQKIIRIIGESRLEIHDISRVEVKKDEVPRFNMPFECGLLLGCLSYGDSEQKKKKMLVLNNIPYQFQKSLSDIAGQDVTAHNNKSTEVITIVRRFLYLHSIESRKKAIPHSMIMIHRYELFQAHLTSIYEELGVSSNLDDLEDLMGYTKVAVKWIKEYQWFPSS
jgi:hypothetical protein